jgi:uncharacterized protein YjdB
MKKVMLLLFALMGFGLTLGRAEVFSFPKVKFIPVNSQYQFAPEDIVSPAESAHLYSFKWVSNNSLISISPEGLASTSSTTGTASLSLQVSKWDDFSKQNVRVWDTTNVLVTVSQPLKLVNEGDSLLVLSRGNNAQLSVVDNFGLNDPNSQNSILWTVEKGDAVTINNSLGTPCHLVANNLGVAVVSGFISSSPNMKVSSIIYVADSAVYHRIYIPLGATHRIDPEEIGLTSSDGTKGFSVDWINPAPHIASVNGDWVLEGKHIGADSLTVVLSSIHSSIEIKVIVYVVDLKFQPDGVRFMGKECKDSFAISLAPESPDLFDTRIRWEMSPPTHLQQVAYFYQNEEDLDTTTWRKVDVISRKTTGDVYLIASLIADENIRDSCLIVVGDLAVAPKTGGYAFVGVGKELELALFPNVDNPAALPEVYWEVDYQHRDVASVDQSGKVTGLKEGIAVITATAKNNLTWRGSVTLQVTNLEIKYVGSNILRPQDSLYLALHGIPAHFVAWTSTQPDLVSVDDNGLVKASDKIGQTFVTASLKHMPDLFCRVPVYVAKIFLNKSDLQWIAPNSSFNFEATLEPYTLTPNLRWFSTDTQIASVDNAGRVTTFSKQGVASIVAVLVDNEAIRASCPIKVGIPVQSLTVSSSHSGSFERGKGYQFSATTAPANAYGPVIRWTSDNPDIAVVDKLGWMVAKSVGTTRIRATEENSGVSHFYDVTVIEPLGLLLNSVSITLREEESFQLRADFLPQGIYTGPVLWHSSNNQVATVTEETGMVYGFKHGVASITATAGAYQAVCLVTVNYALDSIFLNRDTINLDRNTTDRFSLTLSFIPESSKDLFDIEWSSLDEDIASVVGGVVTPHKEGQTKIFARVDDLEDECVVNVIVPLKKLSFNQDSVVIQKQQVLRLAPIAEPADVTAAQRQFTWSCEDESIVSVAADGAVTGLQGGKTRIVATTLDGSFSASYVVIVETPAETILLHQHALSLNRGDKRWLEYTNFPQGVTFPIPAWTSSNTSVATVNNQGVVSAVGSGKAVIVATAQGFNPVFDSCIVTVDNPITGLSLPNHITLERGAEYTLAPATFPADATPQPLDWQTDNHQVATVSNGLIKAMYKGSARITTSVPNGTQTETIVIVTIPAGGLLLSGVVSVKQGYDFSVAARLFPSEASEQRVNWKFSTPDGLSGDLVDLVEQGNLHCILRAKKKGVLTIHATSADGKVSQSHIVNILASSTALVPPDAPALTEGRTVSCAKGGLLHFSGLRGFKANIFSVYGQRVEAFSIDADTDFRQLFLPSGLYIFSASNGDDSVVYKFFLR